MKGGKVKYTLLSDTFLEILKRYLAEYKPRKWLFEGMREGRLLSVKTVQAIFEHAREKAGIKKDVSVHNLRRRFATHWLEGDLTPETLGDISAKERP